MKKADFIVLVDEIRWYLTEANDEVNEEIKNLQKNIENFLFINDALYF